MLFLAAIEGLVLSSIAVLARNVWGLIYTNEAEVVSYLAAVMPVLALSNFMDGIQGVMSGKFFNFTELPIFRLHQTLKSIPLMSSKKISCLVT